MKLEDQVVSLELAKKLKELGVKQYSLWWHYHFEDEEGEIRQKIMTRGMMRDLYADTLIAICSTFTVAELGEMLPDKFFAYHHDNIWQNGDYIEDWNVWAIAGNTEANARAKMLIWLIENEHIKVEMQGK